MMLVKCLNSKCIVLLILEFDANLGWPFYKRELSQNNLKLKICKMPEAATDRASSLEQSMSLWCG